MTSLTLKNLLTILDEQVPLVAPVQSKYRVTDVPSARTVRFYTTRGLVDKPLGHEGTNAVYGYRHLLQILAIKYLQSQYLPLVKIRFLVNGASNRDLELLIPEIAPAQHRGAGRQDHHLTDRLAARPAATTLQPPPAALPDAAGSSQGDPPSIPGADSWHRIEVSPGVELHVHAAALSAEGCAQLRAALLKELARMRGWLEA